MSLFSILNHSSRALTTASTGLSVASNNVANANTQGYARQVVSLGAKGTVRTQGLLLGQGVSAEQVLSTYDRFSQESVFGRSGTSSYDSTRARSFRTIEASFVESEHGTLSDALAGFFDAFSALESDPASSGLRLGVLASGSVAVQFFNQTATALNEQQSSLDQQVQGQVRTLNNLAGQVGSLNARIAQLEAGGGEAHDLRAQRTQVLEQLSGLGPVRAPEDEDGSVRVIFANQLLVEGDRARAVSTAEDPVTGFNQVRIDMGSSTVDISDTLSSGSLGGLITQRDSVVEGLLADLDALAFELASSVNAQHQAGFGLDGGTGRDFFAPIASVDGAAAALSLDAAVDGNPDALAAASVASAPGDNSNATALAALANSTFVTLNGQDFTSFYSSVVSGLGQDASLAYGSEARSNLDLQGARGLRDSISGVSLEEEALDLMRFQDAYQAAARVLTTADEMLDELMNLV